MIEALLLSHFRNWEEQLFQFSPTVNIIQGPNAEGKTSLLEALHLLCLGSSWRTDKLADCIQWGKETFTLKARLLAGGEPNKLSLSSNGKERRLELNGACSEKLSGLIGLQPLVLIAPHDPLIKGAPQERRRFLDITLAQIDPAYLKELSRWKGALLQRNALLRTGETRLLAPWEEEMATASARITAKRRALIVELNQKLDTLYRSLSGEEYAPDFRSEGEPEEAITASWILKQFKERLADELRFGFTLTGPHRARYKIHFSGHDAKQAMSEGQMQNAVTALRLATWELFAEKSAQKPILLIDDFGAALDDRRQQSLLNSLGKFGQTFITTVHDLSTKLLPRETLYFSRSTMQRPA